MMGTSHKTQMQHVPILPGSRLNSDERNIQHKKFAFFFLIFLKDIMPKIKSPCFGNKKKTTKTW